MYDPLKPSRPPQPGSTSSGSRPPYPSGGSSPTPFGSGGFSFGSSGSSFGSGGSSFGSSGSSFGSGGSSFGSSGGSSFGSGDSSFGSSGGSSYMPPNPLSGRSSSSSSSSFGSGGSSYMPPNPLSGSSGGSSFGSTGGSSFSSGGSSFGSGGSSYSAGGPSAASSQVGYPLGTRKIPVRSSRRWLLWLLLGLGAALTAFFIFFLGRRNTAVPVLPSEEEHSFVSSGSVILPTPTPAPTEAPGLVSSEDPDPAATPQPGDLYTASSAIGTKLPFYYQQLTDRQKALYAAAESITIDEILQADEEVVDGKSYHVIFRRVEGVTGMTLSYVLPDGQNTLELTSASKMDVEDFYSDFSSATLALNHDRPELLWVDQTVCSYLYSYENGPITDKRGDIEFVKIYFSCEPELKTQYETMMEQARLIAAQAAQLPGWYEQLKMIHDTIARGSTYAYDSNGEPSLDPMAHCPYGALIPGDAWEPVCEGYATAAKVVCDMLDISCVLVSSEDHMWNNILMENGLWYHMDVTWDDGSDQEGVYTYFLVGDQTLVNDEPFIENASHQATRLDVFMESQGLQAQMPTRHYQPLYPPDVSETAYIP